MYQGSHLPNFEALGVPKSKCQASTHIRQTPHDSIVKDFFETFTKIVQNTIKSKWLLLCSVGHPKWSKMVKILFEIFSPHIDM